MFFFIQIILLHTKKLSNVIDQLFGLEKPIQNKNEKEFSNKGFMY
jgi:hypothetical protein